MDPLARKLIQRRYLDRGITTRVVVLPMPDTGLPESFIDDAKPVTLDLLARRPINLELDAEGMSADLCFSGPPVRCRFPWSTVAAVQDLDDSMVETLAVTVAMVMEDGGLVALQNLDRLASATPAPKPPKRKAPHLRVVGRDDPENP